MIPSEEFEDFITQAYREHCEGNAEDFGYLIRNILKFGDIEIAKNLYSMSEKSIFFLSEALFGITARIIKEGKSEELLKLFEDMLRKILLSNCNKPDRREIQRINQPIVELPINVKPDEEYLTSGLLLSEILLRFKDSFITYYEDVVDPSLPENARPQLLYITRALIRFLEGCGKSFDEFYEEFRFVPERYGMGKEEFRNLTSETGRRRISLEY